MFRRAASLAESQAKAKLRVGVAQRPRALNPSERHHVVAFDSISLPVYLTEVVCCPRIPLGGGAAVPFERAANVALYAGAVTKPRA